jgi:hypothetical protein
LWRCVENAKGRREKTLDSIDGAAIDFKKTDEKAEGVPAKLDDQSVET